MNDYIGWLKSYFSRDTPTLPNDFEAINYFESGLIDSLGIIELIEAIEKEFNIKFSALVFQERRFSTVRGLAEIIHEIKSGVYQ